MLQKKCESVEGIFYWDDQFRPGRYIPDEDRLEILPMKEEYDLFIPLPVNAHTHIGDSFITEEPQGNLMDIVGPGGFKHRYLNSTEEGIIIDHMKKTMRFMKTNYTGSFFDFRETGVDGINTIKAIRKNFSDALILARPSSATEIDSLAGIIDGVGFSSINDHNMEYIWEIAGKMKNPVE
jgi:hypothetical protein